MIGDSYASIAGSNTADPYITYNGSYPNKSKYVYVSDVKDTVDYLDENGNIRVTTTTASLPGVGSGSYHGTFIGGSNGEAGFDAIGKPHGTYNNAKYNFYGDINSTN